MEILSKARIKLIQSLQHKKFRLKYNKFIVEGLKINKELLAEQRSIVEEVYVSNPDFLPLLRQVADGPSILEITPQAMHQISQMSTPPGILSVCTLPQEHQIPGQLKGMKLFYLDAIRDPGNLGTILRIADWFGLDFVLLSPDCVDIFNHKVLQASMGSALRIKTSTLEISNLLSLPIGNLYVADAEGTSIEDVLPPEEGILVLGNESLGVSGEIMHQVKDVLSVPGQHRLGAESLNVASAAAIFAYWWKKK